MVVMSNFFKELESNNIEYRLDFYDYDEYFIVIGGEKCENLDMSMFRYIPNDIAFINNGILDLSGLVHLPSNIDFEDCNDVKLNGIEKLVSNDTYVFRNYGKLELNGLISLDTNVWFYCGLLEANSLTYIGGGLTTHKRVIFNMGCSITNLKKIRLLKGNVTIKTNKSVSMNKLLDIKGSLDITFCNNVFLPNVMSLTGTVDIVSNGTSNLSEYLKSNKNVKFRDLVLEDKEIDEMSDLLDNEIEKYLVDVDDPFDELI